MSIKKTDSEYVQSFIFNDEVQNILSEINNNVMDFNILEITGMGNQEIKHSNILGWLFDDSEHNLEYQILDNFLKKVIEENRQNRDDMLLDELQSYIYLANKKKDITIYREKDDIDLLIVDEANKVVIIIENKVYASERTDGKDGGQLQKYENTIDKKYNKYEKYFIFLTVNLEEPSEGNKHWLKASHQMVTDVIENILKTKEITTKTKIVLESYVDLLKRNGIVADEKLEKLCKEIWAKSEYKSALDILFEHKPDIVTKISNYLQEKLEEKSNIVVGVKKRTYIRFTSNSWNCDAQSKGSGGKDTKDIFWKDTKDILMYQFDNSNKGLNLKLIIGPSECQDFRKKIFEVARATNNTLKPAKKLTDTITQIWITSFISDTDINDKNFEELKKIIDEKLEEFFSEDFDKNNKILDVIMNKKEE